MTLMSNLNLLEVDLTRFTFVQNHIKLGLSALSAAVHGLRYSQNWRQC